jgi:hypothetical protein
VRRGRGGNGKETRGTETLELTADLSWEKNGFDLPNNSLRHKKRKQRSRPLSSQEEEHWWDSEILRPQTDASDPKQNKQTPRTHRNWFYFFDGFHRGLSPEAIKARKTKNKRTRESDLRKNLLLRLPFSSDITDKRRRQRQRHARTKPTHLF